VVEAGAVLLGRRQGAAVGCRARRAAAVEQQHQGQQPGGLGVVGQQLADEARQADRLGAEVRADDAVARRRRVAHVEHEVEHGEHARRARGQLGAARHGVGDARRGDLALGADQALLHGGLAGEERVSNLRRAQAAERAQRQRDAGVERERRVTAGEDQA
jgi:hypothetical protein